MIYSARAITNLAVVLCSILGLVACSSAPEPVFVRQFPAPGINDYSLPPGVTYKVGKPYQISNVWYYPAEDYKYSEEGIASWYGPNFHGKPTANGEVYDMHALTAAHPTLPIPSIVRVTNLENGRVIKLRINDRGPFKNNRIIDVSRRGAQVLGFYTAGITRVRVEIDAAASLDIKNFILSGNPGEMPNIESSPRQAVISDNLPPPKNMDRPQKESNFSSNQIPIEPKPVSEMPSEVATNINSVGNLFIQAGSFSEESNALRLAQQLSDISKAVVSPIVVEGVQYFRVRFGPFNNQTLAEDLLSRVKSYGYDAQVVRD